MRNNVQAIEQVVVSIKFLLSSFGGDLVHPLGDILAIKCRGRTKVPSKLLLPGNPNLVIWKSFWELNLVRFLPLLVVLSLDLLHLSNEASEDH